MSVPAAKAGDIVPALVVMAERLSLVEPAGRVMVTAYVLEVPSEAVTVMLIRFEPPNKVMGADGAPVIWKIAPFIFMVASGSLTTAFTVVDLTVSGTSIV